MLQDKNELGESIAEDLLQLPDLDTVLHNIGGGCIFVTWLITYSEVLEHQIRKRTSLCEDVFRRHNIVMYPLNEECTHQEQVHIHVCVHMHVCVTGWRGSVEGSMQLGSSLKADYTYVPNFQALHLGPNTCTSDAICNVLHAYNIRSCSLVLVVQLRTAMS